MIFQSGDWVIFYGHVCRVSYANADIVATRRVSDGNVSICPPRSLAADQVPWIHDIRGCRRMPTSNQTIEGD